MKLSTIIKHKLKREVEANRFPFEYSYEKFLDDKKEYDELSEIVKYLNKYFQKQLKFDKEYFDFIIRKNAQIIESLKYYFQKSEKAKKDYSEQSYSYKVLNHFWMIFTVITNNYITLKDLFLTGKDYQAKIIFRNTIELTELCISILGDEEFYTFFQKQNNIDHPVNNYQTLKYDGIKKASNKIIKQIKNLPNNNIDKEIWDIYQQMRDESYDNTSKHIHSNYFNLMLNGHILLIDDPDIELKDMAMHNLNGLINAKTKENINEVFVYDSISYMILLILIIDTHKLNFKKLDYKHDYLAILSAYNSELLKYAMKSINRD